MRLGTKKKNWCVFFWGSILVRRRERRKKIGVCVCVFGGGGWLHKSRGVKMAAHFRPCWAKSCCFLHAKMLVYILDHFVTFTMSSCTFTELMPDRFHGFCKFRALHKSRPRIEAAPKVEKLHTSRGFLHSFTVCHRAHHFLLPAEAWWQAKMASIEFWIPRRNMHGPHWQ